MTHARILPAALLSSLTLAAPALADDDLAGHFGFDGLEVVKIDPKAGPILVADLNGDGLEDLVAVNNSKSRIEFQYQKAGAKPTDKSLKSGLPGWPRTSRLPCATCSASVLMIRVRSRLPPKSTLA